MVFALATVIVVATFCFAEHPSLPSSFQSKTIHSPEGADLYVRWGGSGPVAMLIHGYAENSDSWAPLAADLMKDHTVTVTGATQRCACSPALKPFVSRRAEWLKGGGRERASQQPFSGANVTDKKHETI